MLSLRDGRNGMNDPFEGSRRKLARGEYHLEILKRDIDAFFKENPYERVIEPNPELPGYVDWKIRISKPVPEHLAETIGDVATNLRAALDHAVYAFAIAGGRTKPREAYFPISGSADAFEPNMKGRCRDVPQEIYPILRMFKPYKGGNDLLWALNEVCLRDKHILLMPICNGAVVNKGKVVCNPADVRFPADATWHRGNNEIVFFSAKAEAQLYYDLKVTAFIAFDEIEVIRGKPVCGFFDSAARAVEIAIAAIEGRARAVGFIK
ncbi:MAG: hypothetical protein ABSH32_09335 [Bryobacteraceae bacterium]|jgi:hypothetical protein